MENFQPDKKEEYEYYNDGDYCLIEKYDAHMHLNTFDPGFVSQSKEDNFRLLTINVDVGADFPTVQQQQDFAVHQSNNSPGSLYFASTFSVQDFDNDNWCERAIAQIKKSIASGAVAVKVWKNIGMELRDANGKFVMIDHPRFDPVIEYLAENNIPLIGHLGEPKNCWLPLEEMTVTGDVNYFRAHPEYHMYLHPEYPSYNDQLKARDRMLAKHRNLRFIGAHLGSLEWNIDDLATTLEMYPNMAVDTAERISHLQLQTITDWEKVRNFLIMFQDRIIYGTDIIVDGTKPADEMKMHAHDIRRRHWKFFTSDEVMQVPKVNGAFRGLKLPRTVIDKVYRTNAEKWFPGLKNN